MASANRQFRLKELKVPADARRAGVLILFYEIDDRHVIPLIRRTEDGAFLVDPHFTEPGIGAAVGCIRRFERAQRV